MLTDIEKRINELADDMSVHGAILIMGAGSSFEAGMPLYAQFCPIIWQILDTYPDLKTKMGYDSAINAKCQFIEGSKTLRRFFDILESDKNALDEFKKIFVTINNDHHNPASPMHIIIAKLIHNGLIKLVVSFNWDDLLETAWTSLYGTDINSCKIQLIKPHGSVRRQNRDWILPNSDGQITDADLLTIQKLHNGTPMTLIIVGYSESDRVIIDKLISPRDKLSKVYRISPSVKDSISTKASAAFDYLQSRVLPNNNACLENIDFSNQVGLEHAIMGYRLLPCDVTACARLPQIDDITLRINQAHSVIIKGEPGC